MNHSGNSCLGRKTKFLCLGTNSRCPRAHFKLGSSQGGVLPFFLFFQVLPYFWGVSLFFSPRFCPFFFFQVSSLFSPTFFSKIFTSKASFPQNSPQNIPKLLKDTFGLESGGKSSTLSPSWDIRGAKSLDQAQHFLGWAWKREREKKIFNILKKSFSFQFCRKFQQVWENPPQRAKLEVLYQALVLLWI